MIIISIYFSLKYLSLNLYMQITSITYVFSYAYFKPYITRMVVLYEAYIKAVRSADEE